MDIKQTIIDEIQQNNCATMATFKEIIGRRITKEDDDNENWELEGSGHRKHVIFTVYGTIRYIAINQPM